MEFDSLTPNRKFEIAVTIELDAAIVEVERNLFSIASGSNDEVEFERAGAAAVVAEIDTGIDILIVDLAIVRNIGMVGLAKIVAHTLQRLSSTRLHSSITADERHLHDLILII